MSRGGQAERAEPVRFGAGIDKKLFGEKIMTPEKYLQLMNAGWDHAEIVAFFKTIMDIKNDGRQS